MDEHDRDGNLSGTLMRDLAFSIAFVFIILFLFLVPFIKPAKAAKDAEIKMPGNIMVWIRWPDYVDVDVDLWAQSPGDKPVGYSNRAGNTFNLLRDDLGNTRDTTKLNYEIVFGRDMPDGRYTVNVHLFRNGSELTEIPIDVDVFISYGSSSASIVKKSVILKQVGQEFTIVNFVLENGKLIGKPDDTYTQLRSDAVGWGQ